LVKTHARKFLNSLIRFIEKQTPLFSMSLDEARQYYGILNRKLHKGVGLLKKKVERAKIDKGITKQIFKVEKVRRPLPFKAWKDHISSKKKVDLS